MGRPFKERTVRWRPQATLFKPAGVPASAIRVTPVALDELEAIRLIDDEGLDQGQASAQMDVSRPTVGRILARGRRKIAHALVRGEALAIQQGAAPVGYKSPRRRTAGSRQDTTHRQKGDR